MEKTLGRKEEPYEETLVGMGIVAITINDIAYDVAELIHKKKETD